MKKDLFCVGIEFKKATEQTESGTVANIVKLLYYPYRI